MKNLKVWLRLRFNCFKGKCITIISLHVHSINTILFAYLYNFNAFIGGFSVIRNKHFHSIYKIHFNSLCAQV